MRCSGWSSDDGDQSRSSSPAIIRYRSPGHGRFRYFAVGVANAGSTPIGCEDWHSVDLRHWQSAAGLAWFYSAPWPEIGPPCTSGARCCVLGSDRFLGKPNRQAVSLASAGVILPPVRDLEPLPGDVVATGRFRFERHGTSGRNDGAFPYAGPLVLPTTGSLQQRHSRLFSRDVERLIASTEAFLYAASATILLRLTARC
jgi:hypothetical protein